MKIGFIGLGKMGANMVLRLLEKKHEIVVWNRSAAKIQSAVAAGAVASTSLADCVEKLERPRTVWVMLPAGEVTSDCIVELTTLLDAGDTIIDGGNSRYTETVRVAQTVAGKGVHFLDVGVSGGPSGARNGACLMIGGDVSDFHRYQSLFKDIAAPGALQHFQGIGAGHFVKMVHNGIEYGMMQAIAEGMTIIKKSHYSIPLEKAAAIYANSSVISSRLIDWLQSGLTKHDPELSTISGTIAHSGEGMWTVETAKEMSLTVPVIDAALQYRINSAITPSFTGKIVSLLRNEFGGHEVGVSKSESSEISEGTAV